MEDLNRSPKSSSKWVTSEEMDDFNIKVILQDTQEFFGTADLPVPENISPIIWNQEKAPPGRISKTTRQFFAYLEDAMDSRFPHYEETTVIDFAVFLLGMLDYDDGDRRLLHTRKEMPFYMEDGRVDVKADATVIERQTSRFYQYILLVHENKCFRFASGVDPEAQLIAQAIGAFQRNNRIRKRAKISELKSQTFPAITIFGTAVTFYKITITEELAMAVESDIFPAETIVHAFVPLPLSRYIDQGMGPLENRRLVLQCFEAFKQFMARVAPPLSRRRTRVSG